MRDRNLGKPRVTPNLTKPNVAIVASGRAHAREGQPTRCRFCSYPGHASVPGWYLDGAKPEKPSNSGENAPRHLASHADSHEVTR